MALPKNIEKGDLKQAGWDDKDRLAYSDVSQFELWLITDFGWVIPTLSIGSHGQRTYAVAVGEGGTLPIRPVRVKRGAQVRVGRGPHVLCQLTVHARKSTSKRLMEFFELRNQGAVDANVTRDRISSRRAQGSVMRSEGRRSWRWDV